MAEPQSDESVLDLPLTDVEKPITPKALLSSFVAGVVGLAVMAPVAVGIPAWLGLFRLRPDAGFEFLVGASPTPGLPVVFFVLGGGIVVPLFFLVTATYLPPATPRYLRGVTISVIFWPGFVIVFWPFASAWTNTVFLVVSFVSHLLYGLVLGVVLQSLTGIPEHEV